MEKLHDPVNHPSHYTDGKYEVIDFIESHGLGFHLGNAVKYISRAGKKNKDKEIEDLNKAIWYLKRAISSKESLNIRMVTLKSQSPISVGEYCSDKGLHWYCASAINHIVGCVNAESCYAAIWNLEQRIKGLEETKNEKSD